MASTDYCQTTLDLFEPATLEELCRQLSIDKVSLHPSRRLKTGWYLTIHRTTKHRELHYPHILDYSPYDIRRSLLLWADLPVRTAGSSRAEYRAQKRLYEKNVRTYLDNHSPSGRHTREYYAAHAETQGTVYDLDEVFSAVNTRYFDGSLSALLRWGAPASKTSFQRSRRDPDGTVWNSITIAGIYNHPDVPRFAIESILFHEMLHIHVPPEMRNERRVVHGREFRRLEKAFPCYEAWHSWEKETLPGLVKQLRRRKKR